MENKRSVREVIEAYSKDSRLTADEQQELQRKLNKSEQSPIASVLEQTIAYWLLDKLGVNHQDADYDGSDVFADLREVAKSSSIPEATTTWEY